MNKEKTNKFEQAVVSILNIDGWQLNWCCDTNNLYDAEGLTPEKEGKRNKCVIEIKFRNVYYEDKLLEKNKYDSLMALDDDIVKLYFVFDPKGNYLYWLNKLNMPEPQSKNLGKTSLWANQRVAKEIYLLPESKATIIQRNSNERAQKSVWDEYLKKQRKISF